MFQELVASRLLVLELAFFSVGARLTINEKVSNWHDRLMIPMQQFMKFLCVILKSLPSVQ
jgi:hypothetical protein